MLGERVKSPYRRIVASGEKDPAGHQVTVARRHREETSSGGTVFLKGNLTWFGNISDSWSVSHLWNRMTAHP